MAPKNVVADCMIGSGVGVADELYAEDLFGMYDVDKLALIVLQLNISFYLMH